MTMFVFHNEAGDVISIMRGSETTLLSAAQRKGLPYVHCDVEMEILQADQIYSGYRVVDNQLVKKD